MFRIRGDSPDPALLARAASILTAGGLLIYPTDTLYALGGDPRNAEVARRVRAAKGRGEGKPLPLVAADREQVRSLCAAWSPDAERLGGRFWPGPLTLVLPADASLPVEVTEGLGTIAVRVPALSLARQLCALAGPLISTSANRSGQPPPATCQDAVRAVGSAADLVLDAGPGRQVPSTIVDLTAGAPRLVRAGAVSWSDVEAVLSEGRA